MARARRQPPAGVRRRGERSWPLLVMAVLAVFAALGLGRFGYSALLPAMQASLGFSNTQAGALASWNLAGYVAMAVVAGELTRRFGPRRVVAAGLAVAGLAMLATGLVQGVASAAVARALTGAGAGAVNVPMMAMVGSWFAVHRRGLAAGVAVSGSSVALVLAGPLVPQVIAATGATGWRLCWFAFGATAIVLAVVALLVLRDRPDEPVGSSAGDTPPVRAEVGSVYRSPFAWRLGVVYFTFGFSYMIYLTFFVTRLTGDLGMSGASAGTYFMVLGWASLLCGVVWGYASDFIGRKHTLVIISVLHAVAFASFALWTTPLGLLFSAVVFGLTAWSTPGIVAAACGDAFGRALAATGLGFLTLFLGAGQVAGPLIGGALADRASSFAPSYLVAAAVALAGAVAALLVPTVAACGAPEPAAGGGEVLVSGEPALRED